MTDYTPKKPRRDSGVNADIPDLAAWDHRLGDPERHGWRDLHTGADVRLSDVNQPSSYERLTDEKKAAIQGWFGRELVPMDVAGLYGSYSLKHVFEGIPGGFYLTNGEMKGAMLAAGFEPVDRYELNWRFHYGCDPELLRLGIAADIERWRVA